MDLKDEVRGACRSMNQIGIFGLHVLWNFLQLVISLWYLGVGIANVLESSLISSGLQKHYKDFDSVIGVKHICLYDMEGVVKKSKESIIEKLNNVVLFEGAAGKDLLLDQEHVTLEFASVYDGTEAVAKAANFLFVEHLELTNTRAEQEDWILTKHHMTEALRTVVGGQNLTCF